ncbi:MAG: type II secretion system F family protein [Candidatus Diapherotrites archaeon]|nr:type II secretion system F family protein [Candidatus Diapherotrites archaeon]
MAPMNKTQIPFSPLPFPVLLFLAKKFRGIGASISKSMPYLKLDLRYAEIDVSVEDYGGMMFVLFAFYFAVVSLLAYLFAVRFGLTQPVLPALTLGAIMAFLILVQLSLYPKIKVKKKERDIERNLIFSLRTLLVEIKSGVTLFESIKLIAYGDFGGVSREFKKAVKEIETGRIQESALEDIASFNPSFFFRRTLWQLLNGLKAGADVSVVLRSLVDTLAKEQRNQVRKYGSSLKLLSLVYMMLGVIVPALGLTFLIILASFPQIKIQEWMFWGLLIFLLIGQFMFLGVLKTNRPSLIEGE